MRLFPRFVFLPLLVVPALCAQVPGERPPPELVARARPALEAGRKALESNDAAAIADAAKTPGNVR